MRTVLVFQQCLEYHPKMGMRILGSMGMRILLLGGTGMRILLP